MLVSNGKMAIYISTDQYKISHFYGFGNFYSDSCIDFEDVQRDDDMSDQCLFCLNDYDWIKLYHRIRWASTRH